MRGNDRKRVEWREAAISAFKFTDEVSYRTFFTYNSHDSRFIVKKHYGSKNDNNTKRRKNNIICHVSNYERG